MISTRSSRRNSFCFISGLFTPRSLTRKGTREFMRDKLLRYGLPYLVFYFVLNPLIWVTLCAGR